MFIFSALISFLLFLISTFIDTIYFIPNLGITLSYASIYLFFSNLIFYFESTFVGIWLFKYYSISKIIFNSLKLVIILLNLLINFSITLIIAFYALISLIHFLLFLVIQIRLKNIKKIFSLDFVLIKKILRFSVFIFLPEIFLFIITTFNQFILAYYISPYNFGIYSITFTIIQILSLPIIVFSNIVFPYVSYYMPKEGENGESIQKIFKSTFYYGLLIMIPITIFFFVFSDMIIVNFFSLAYYDASFYLRLFIFYLNFKMIDIVGGHFLWAANKPKLVFKLYAITAIFTVILSLVLIPFFFAYGAILAIMIPHIIYIITTLSIVKKANKIKLNSIIKISIIKFIISSIVSSLIVQSLILVLNVNIYNFYSLIILSIIYFGSVVLLLFATKAIQLDQIKDLIKFLKISLNLKN
ncbi:MAG: oligosaccharide flippase family protein [Candidatus Hodarchaeota archaeon]